MTDITLPRSVVEKALKALYEADSLMEHHTNIELRRSALVELRAALEQPQVKQEPVAWMTEDGRVATDDLKRSAMASSSKVSFKIPLYTHPSPQRQPLTNEEIFDAIRPLCNNDTNCHAIIGLSIDEYRAIERAHGIGGEK